MKNTCRRYSIIILCGLVCPLVILAGCKPVPHDQVIVRVNDYELTAPEFDRQFREFNFGREDTLEARKAFLDVLIRQKLILQQAQAQGLDRTDAFLQGVEKYWEESLTRIALEEKIKKIDAGIDKGAAADEKRIQEDQMLKIWVEQLRGKAHIDVKEQLLKR